MNTLFLYLSIFTVILGTSIGIGNLPFAKLEAQKFLEAQGYSNITMTGYNFFNCYRGDIFKESFQATNNNGVEVSGTVCWGFLNGKVSRF